MEDLLTMAERKRCAKTRTDFISVSLALDRVIDDERNKHDTITVNRSRIAFA